MKHVVVQSELHGSDIRPATLLSRFRDLSIEEARAYFGDGSRLVEVDCPACGASARRPAFDKNGFHYQQCAGCLTVYVSPRPTTEALDDYRAHSRALEFRASEFLQATSQARRFLILHGHALWLGRLYDETGNHSARGYADWGTNYPTLFDEINRLELFDSMTSIAPLRGLEQACRDSGAQIANQIADYSGEPLGVISSFEQIEHFFSPADMLRKAHGILADGGMLVFTTRTISGFDLQVLWDKVPYIYVPEHLNLLSVEGIAQLIENCGYELVELSTPGQLDVELTQQAMAEDPTIRIPFFEYIAGKRPDALPDLQAFLQKNRLSSHVRVAAVKKVAPASRR